MDSSGSPGQGTTTTAIAALPPSLAAQVGDHTILEDLQGPLCEEAAGSSCSSVTSLAATWTHGRPGLDLYACHGPALDLCRVLLPHRTYGYCCLCASFAALEPSPVAHHQRSGAGTALKAREGAVASPTLGDVRTETEESADLWVRLEYLGQREVAQRALAVETTKGKQWQEPGAETLGGNSINAQPSPSLTFVSGKDHAVELRASLQKRELKDTLSTESGQPVISWKNSCW